MAKIIDGLLYTNSHEWVRIDNEYAYIGITDFSQNQLGDIKYISQIEKGTNLSINEEFGSLESTKATSDLLSPVTGTIIDINQDVLNSPDLINTDPYSSWIIKIKLDNPSELDGLMNSNTYKKYADVTE